MTETKLSKLQVSLAKAEDKVLKIEGTIEKHFKKLDKLAAVEELEGLNIDHKGFKYGVRYAAFKAQINHLEELKCSFATATTQPQYWAMCDLMHKMEDINSSYTKLAKAQEVVSGWEAKVAKEAANTLVASQAPQVIVDFLDKWEAYAVSWFMHNDVKPDEARIRAYVANEKQIKLVGLTMRVSEKVGNITDAKGLSISEKGDLTGTIIGDNGKAYVQSIMAGGYNIQCFHFRTLVHSI